MTTLDWNALIKDAGNVSTAFEPLPEGKYLLEVVKSDPAVTASDKTMFKLRTKVIGGEFNGRLIFDNLVISPENQTALKIVLSKFYALGIPSDFFQRSPMPTNDEIAKVLLGRKFVGTVVQSTYKGKLGNNIDKYESAAPADSAVVAENAFTPAAAPAPSGAPALAPAPTAATPTNLDQPPF